jgi:hypothetical protein
MRHVTTSLGFIALVGFSLSVALSSPAAGGIFTEDFSDNFAGWTLGPPEWQIGPAAASTGHQYGNPDPAGDHTPSADNGVAGAVIGGNVTTAPHGLFYLTSPPIDTSDNLTSTLQFWRWLNSDNERFMRDVVEVYNGSQWVRVWETPPGDAGPADAAWTFQTFDVTAYQNSAMQIRFGHSVNQAGAFRVSGWNIDDVTVVPEPMGVGALAVWAMLALGRRTRYRHWHQ